MLPIYGIFVLALDYGFLAPIDSDSDGITVVCSLWISRILHDIILFFKLIVNHLYF